MQNGALLHNGYEAPKPEAPQQKPSKENNTFYFILFLSSVIAIAFGYFLDSRNELKMDAPEKVLAVSALEEDVDTSTIKPEHTTSTPAEKPTDWKIYSEYKKIDVYQNGLVTPADYLNNASQALSDAGRKVEIVGEIKDAYIYIKAGASDERGVFTAIKPEYDGIWFYRKDGEFTGGILNLSESRRGEDGAIQSTQLLYNLKDVPVAKNNTNYRRGEYESINILEYLKSGDYIAALVSTARYGRIVNLTIGYSCAETTPNCVLSIIR